MGPEGSACRIWGIPSSLTLNQVSLDLTEMHIASCSGRAGRFWATPAGRTNVGHVDFYAALVI